MNRANLKPRDVTRMVQMRRSGASIAEIARATRRAKATVAKEILRSEQQGSPPKPTRPRYLAPEERTRIRALLASGMPTRAVAREMGCAQSSVWRVSHETIAPGAPDGARLAVTSSAGIEYFHDETQASTRYAELLRQGTQAACWRRVEVEVAAKIK